MNARSQLQALSRQLSYSSFDVWREIDANRKAVFLNFPYWAVLDSNDVPISREERDSLLEFIARRWIQSDIPFPLPSPGGQAISR